MQQALIKSASWERHKGAPLFLSQNIKKIKVGTLWETIFFDKSRMPKKNEKGGPFSLARYCMLRRKKKNVFGSVL